MTWSEFMLIWFPDVLLPVMWTFFKFRRFWHSNFFPRNSSRFFRRPWMRISRGTRRMANRTRRYLWVISTYWASTPSVRLRIENRDGRIWSNQTCVSPCHLMRTPPTGTDRIRASSVVRGLWPVAITESLYHTARISKTFTTEIVDGHKVSLFYFKLHQRWRPTTSVPKFDWISWYQHYLFRVRWINIVFHLKTVQYSEYHCASTLGLWDMIITYTGTSTVLPQREYERYMYQSCMLRTCSQFCTVGVFMAATVDLHTCAFIQHISRLHEKLRSSKHIESRQIQYIIVIMTSTEMQLHTATCSLQAYMHSSWCGFQGLFAWSWQYICASGIRLWCVKGEGPNSDSWRNIYQEAPPVW